MHWIILLPFSVGIYYSVLVHYPSQSLATSLPALLSYREFVRCYLFGLFVVLWATILMLSGAVDRNLIKVGASPIFADARTSLAVVMDSIRTAGVAASAHSSSSSSEMMNNDVSTNSRSDDNNGQHGHDVWNVESLNTSLKAIQILTLLPAHKQLVAVMSIITACLLVEVLYLQTPSVLMCTPSQIHFIVQHWFWTHLLVYCFTLVLVKKALSRPLMAWFEWCYNSIKDENYLVGMELQNSEQVS